MLEDFNLLEIFWDYDIIVTIDMPTLGYYSALGFYSAGKNTSKKLLQFIVMWSYLTGFFIS